MKIEIITLAIIAIIAFAVKANGVEVSDRLLNAIYQVESSGGKFLKGDKSKKTGEYRELESREFIDAVRELYGIPPLK